MVQGCLRSGATSSMVTSAIGAWEHLPGMVRAAHREGCGRHSQSNGHSRGDAGMIRAAAGGARPQKAWSKLQVVDYD